MEKRFYALRAPDGADGDTFGAQLLKSTGMRLRERGAERVTIHIVDAAVAAGAHLRQGNMQSPVSAVISFWLNSAPFRAPFETEPQTVAARISGYVVSESAPIPNMRDVPADGGRTPGFNRIAFLQKPPRPPHGGWLTHWMRHHTMVAVETQSNFDDCQDIVQRPLIHGAPGWHGFVEECFPAEAMTDPQVFFNAAGDPAAFDAKLQRMMDSCHAFIDFDRTDVILASECRLGGWRDLEHPDVPSPWARTQADGLRPPGGSLCGGLAAASAPHGPAPSLVRYGRGSMKASKGAQPLRQQ